MCAGCVEAIVEASELTIEKIAESESFRLDPPLLLEDIIRRPVLISVVERRVTHGHDEAHDEYLSAKGTIARPDGTPKTTSFIDDRFLSDESKGILRHLLPLPGSLPLGTSTS